MYLPQSIHLPFPFMKTLRLVVLFGALASVALAAPIPANSTITAATVYADRAVVTRSARLDLPAGQSEITFAGLPANLADQSLQVTGRGAAATILDVNARVVYSETTADPRVQTAETELTGLQHQDRILKDKAAALDQQRALLTKIETAVTQPPAKDSTTPRPSFDDWQKLLSFSADNAARLAADRQTLDNDREALALKITAAQARLDDLRGRQTGPRATKTVTVRVAAAQPGALDVTVAYAVEGASWTPAYDARLHVEARTVELTYFGVVRNATGEDWKNIALTLSTARPNLGGGAPELYPWIVDVIHDSYRAESSQLGFFSKKPKRPDPSATLLGPSGGMQAFSNSSIIAGAAADGLTSDAPVIAVASDMAVATVDTAATSASFKIPVAATLPSASLKF